jgi:hypothetical protein
MCIVSINVLCTFAGNGDGPGLEDSNDEDEDEELLELLLLDKELDEELDDELLLLLLKWYQPVSKTTKPTQLK